MDERQAPPDFRPELSGGRFEHRRGPRFEGGRFQPGSGRGQSGVGQGFVPGRNEATGARSTGARGGAGGATRPEVGAAARGRGSTEAARGRNHGFGSGNEERERTAGRQGTTGTATGAPERTHGPRETGGEAESDAESDEVYEDGEPIPGQPYIYPWPTCKDVRDVYREMYIGFTGYMPALVELENAHGSAWRRGKGQRQRFNEKVQICKYVERIQAEHGFENAITAVEFLAGKYRSLKSLLKDMRALKKAEKQGD